MKCEGSCDRLSNGHRGEVVLVHVYDDKNSKDWGEYWYCQDAINSDRHSGFRVEEVKIKTTLSKDVTVKEEE